MFEVLRAYLEKMFPVTDEEFALFRELYIPLELKKGEIFQREGEVVKYGIFVTKGCLRNYMIDNKGREHIVMFAPENWWVADSNSLMNGTPTTYFVDAIEDSVVLLSDKKANETIMSRVPAFARSFQTGVQKHAAAKDKRIVQSLAATAEERYLNFLETYSTIAQRVPQHMLASYLGVTPETVSRIRKSLTRKK
jgi:CRP-like cAMP-binding protein